MKKIIILLFSALLIHSTQINLFAQRSEHHSIDSLLNVRLTAKEKAPIDLEIARYYFTRDQDSLSKYTIILENHLKKDYDKRIEAFVLKFKGYEAYSKLEMDKSLVYGRESFLLFKDLADFKEMGWIKSNLGNNYYRMGDLDNAAEQFLFALDFFEKAEHFRGIGEAYYNLGRISYKSGHLQQAQSYYEKALIAFNSIDLSHPSLRVYRSLGILLIQNKDIEGALSNLIKAANGFKENFNQRELALTYGHIARCYELLNQRKTAINYSRLALKSSISANDMYGIISGYINYGSFLCLEAEFDSSMIYLGMGLQMAVEFKIPELEEDVYKEYENLHIALNDYKNAHEYRHKFDSVNRIIVDTESQQRIERLSFNYQNKLEEQELKRLRAHKTAQAKITFILIAVIVIILILISILIFSYLKIRKQRTLLGAKNELLNEYNKQLEVSEKNLLELVEDKNKLFSIIAHDLRNPVAAVTGFAELLAQSYSEISEQKKMEYIGHISHASERAMSLLENLLMWARSQMNLIEIKKKEINVSKLIFESSESLMSSIEQKDLELSTEIDEDFTLFVDQEMIKTVIRNILSNAIKFSFPESKISISAYRNEDLRCISIEDKGIGIEANKLEELLSSRHIDPTKGTLNETGSGLGLQISKDFIQKNNGRLQASSVAGKGTIFSICFPHNEGANK